MSAQHIIDAATGCSLPLPEPVWVMWQLRPKASANAFLQYQSDYTGPASELSGLVPWEPTQVVPKHPFVFPSFRHLISGLPKPPITNPFTPLLAGIQSLLSRCQNRLISALTAVRPVSLLTSCVSTPKRALFTAAVLIGFASYLYMRYHRYAFRDLYSALLRKCATPYPITDDLIRRQFSDLPSPEVTHPIPNHTHGLSAAQRSNAVLFSQRLSLLLGLNPHVVDRTRALTKKGLFGEASFRVTKQTMNPPAPHYADSRQLRIYVDSDHFHEMPTNLAHEFTPTLLCTFQPNQVARVTDEYDYTFDADNNVIYRVTGGETYSHRVWNYSLSHFLATDTVFGFPIRASLYCVDRRPASEDHEIILCTPVYTWGLFTAWLACLLPHPRLVTLKPCTNGFLRLDVVSSGGTLRSTGRPGSYAQATLPITDDDTIASIARTSKVDITLPTASQFVDGDREAAALLTEYHKSKVLTKPDTVFPVAESLRRYQFEPERFDEGAKASLKPFMSPLINDCFAPDRTPANERAAVKARVLDVKSDAKVTPPLAKAIKEFVDCLIPNKHELHPVDDAHVAEQQNRPDQRAINARAESYAAMRVGAQFLKKEPYNDIKPPRIITTFNAVDKVAYAKFVYALADYVKTMPWYAFGSTPDATSERVVDLLKHAQSAVNTDFSKFDGHLSPVMRELEQCVLMAAFHPDHHAALLELHAAHYNLVCYGEMGSVYEMDTTRGSGAMDTALFNTIVNAFIAFLTFRVSKRTMTPLQAYTSLGVYGGDDGLTADIDPELYKVCASRVGQELTMDVVQRGNFGVTFLARMYGPLVWEGEKNSCCDINRQVSKLHVTVNLPPSVTPEMKFLEKIRSYSLSDLRTPIIGDICRRAIEILGQTPVANPHTSKVSTWLSFFPLDVQYKNVEEDWMMFYARQSCPGFDFPRMQKWLADSKSITDLLSPPICQEQKAPTPCSVPVAVDASVIPARSGKDEALDIPAPLVTVKVGAKPFKHARALKRMSIVPPHSRKPAPKDLVSSALRLTNPVPYPDTAIAAKRRARVSPRSASPK